MVSINAVSLSVLTFCRHKKWQMIWVLELAHRPTQGSNSVHISDKYCLVRLGPFVVGNYLHYFKLRIKTAVASLFTSWIFVIGDYGFFKYIANILRGFLQYCPLDPIHSGPTSESFSNKYSHLHQSWQGPHSLSLSSASLLIWLTAADKRSHILSTLDSLMIF